MNEEVEKALEVIKKGGVILYPTETVWGIGCDATNQEAVAKIYAIKKRAEQKSMIVLLDNVDNVVKYVKDVPEIAWQLWEVSDKPLTLILPNGVGVAGNLLPEEKSIAIRITTNNFCKQLIRKMGRPLISTSANISGEKTPAKFSEISKEIIESVDYVVSEEMSFGATGAASSIIKVDVGNVIQIIRP